LTPRETKPKVIKELKEVKSKEIKITKENKSVGGGDAVKIKKKKKTGGPPKLF